MNFLANPILWHTFFIVMKIFIRRYLLSGYREEIKKENEVKGEREGERRG